MILGAIVVGLGVSAGPAAAAADSPTVAPATGGAGVPLVFGHFADVDAIGYQTAEFFLSGNAHSYTTGAPLTPDGKWNAIPSNPTTAAYTTRVVVHTPKNAKRFNGTVYVEWLNVSGGVDGSPDWSTATSRWRARAPRTSSSPLSSSASISSRCGSARGSSRRSGSLRLAGRIPATATRTTSSRRPARRSGMVPLLGSLVPKRVIAMGESQSAGRLVTYINAVHPLVDVYDGFVVHSRGAGGAALSQAPLPSIPVTLTAIRDDLAAPVIVFQAETDVANSRLLARADRDGQRQVPAVGGRRDRSLRRLRPDHRPESTSATDRARSRTSQQLQNPTHDPDTRTHRVRPRRSTQDRCTGCSTRRCTGSTAGRVRHAASDRAAPARPPRRPGVFPVVFAVDAHGNTLGGIRTPYVDVPIATLTGFGNGAAPGAPPTSVFCGSFGQTVPFTDAQLDALYPNHVTFVAKYVVATVRAVFSGYLMPDNALFVRAAAQSDIGG